MPCVVYVDPCWHADVIIDMGMLVSEQLPVKEWVPEEVHQAALLAFTALQPCTEQVLPQMIIMPPTISLQLAELLHLLCSRVRPGLPGVAYP